MADSRTLHYGYRAILFESERGIKIILLRFLSRWLLLTPSKVLLDSRAWDKGGPTAKAQTIVKLGEKA